MFLELLFLKSLIDIFYFFYLDCYEVKILMESQSISPKTKV